MRILIFIIILLIIDIVSLVKNPKVVKIITNVFKNTFYDKNKIINKESTRDKKTYVRELSFANDLYYIYWLAFKHDIIRNKSNIMSAMLLKLHQEGKVKILDKKTDKFISKGDFAINLYNDIKNLDDVEIKFYDILKEASGDMLLSENEFFKYICSDGVKVTQFINYLLDFETDKLIKSNLIIKKEDYLIESDKVKEDVKNLIGFKNFLEDFTNFRDKNFKSSEFWDEYIVISQLLGINFIINEEFKLLYPWLLYDINLDEEENYDN